MREQLFDPASAQFKDLKTVNGVVGLRVCGRVNAKNRFGGYIGFRPFYYDEDTKSVALQGVTREDCPNLA